MKVFKSIQVEFIPIRIQVSVNDISSESFDMINMIFFNFYFLEQLCEYQIVESVFDEDNTLVRSIRSNKKGDGYDDNQQCWASFKCPTGMFAYWRRVKFVTERGHDQVRFFGVNNKDYRVFSGELHGSASWDTLSDNEITFEFKSDESGNWFGELEIYLTCK